MLGKVKPRNLGIINGCYECPHTVQSIFGQVWKCYNYKGGWGGRVIDPATEEDIVEDQGEGAYKKFFPKWCPLKEVME